MKREKNWPKAMEEILTCARCMFWSDTTAECRRGPPTVFPFDGTGEFMWPIVDDTDWCGEFKDRVKEVKK